MTGEGKYAIPDAWPNCTETVACGSPPDKPFNGSVTWILGAQDDVSRQLSEHG